MDTNEHKNELNLRPRSKEVTSFHLISVTCSCLETNECQNCLIDASALQDAIAQ